MCITKFFIHFTTNAATPVTPARRARRCNIPIAVLVVASLLPAAVFAGGQGEPGSARSSGDAAGVGAAPAEDLRPVRVEFLVGEVTINGDPAEIGDPVPAGAEIVTGPQGRVEIVFGSGNIIEIRAATELTLDTANPANGIDLRRGQFAAVFDRLETIGMGRNDTFAVQTPATVAGVRGTAFFVAVESDDQTYVCTCNGTLNFGDDGELSVTAARHEAYRFVADGQTARRIPAPEIYHTTDEFNRLAEAVDVTIEWGDE